MKEVVVERLPSGWWVQVYAPGGAAAHGPMTEQQADRLVRMIEGEAS